MPKIQVGNVLTPRELPTIVGPAVRVPDAVGPVHLQFRRYAGCPICTTHLRTFTTRHDEIVAAGVQEVVVFHSDRATLLELKGDLPFDVIPDPARVLYREFGVERSWLAFVHPANWWAVVRGWSPSLGLRAGPGGHLGLPADFLIGPDGRVRAVKYGGHASDHWTVDDVLDLAGKYA